MTMHIENLRRDEMNELLTARAMREKGDMIGAEIHLRRAEWMANDRAAEEARALRRAEFGR